MFNISFWSTLIITIISFILIVGPVEDKKTRGILVYVILGMLLVMLIEFIINLTIIFIPIIAVVIITTLIYKIKENL